jgi:hypothetical protein
MERTPLGDRWAFGARRPNGVRRHRMSLLSMAVSFLLMLGMTGAFADNTLPDGDGVTPLSANALTLGTVCVDQAVNGSALIGITRQGNYATANVFKKGTTATVSVQSQTTGLSSTVAPPNTISIPSNWDTAANGTVAGNVAADVTLTAGSTPGSFAGAVVFRSTGTQSDNTTLVRDGTLSVTATISDTGDCASASDTTAPAITYTQSSDGNADWFKTAPATVSVTATDVDDNVSSIDCTLDGSSVSLSNTTGIGTSNIASGVISTSVDGNHAVSCTATDSNSNTTDPAATTSLKLDTVAPAITDEGANPGTPNGTNGWYITAVSNGFSATDATSGLDATCAAAFPNNVSTGSNEGSAVTVSSAGCSDVAGNTNSGISSAEFMIDLTSPTVTCASTPTFLLNQAGAQVSAAVTDGVSGPAASPVTAAADTSSVGSKTAAVTGYDKAGLSTTVNCSYSVAYGFAGFFSPVDNPSVMNSAKAGQAIPLKWRLVDANNVPITNLSGVNLTVASLSCAAGTTADAVEEYAAGSSGLQNLGDGYYQFNWKTPASYASSCKTLKLDLGEGTFHMALFQFKK